MAVSTSLVPIPDLPGRVTNPNQVQLGEQTPLTFNLNRGGDIRPRSAFIRTIQYTIAGLTDNEVQVLTSIAEGNIVADINAQTPIYRQINVGGQDYPNSYLVKVTPSGALTVSGRQLVEQVVLTYETLDRYVT